MARLPRLYIPGCPQHIIQRGNNRCRVFLSDKDRMLFLNLLRNSAIDHGVAVHAYVLMDNHFHLLATPQAPESLPKLLQSVGRKYVCYFNQSYGRSGTLWEGRYKSTVVDSRKYLLTCMAYVDLNPVRAGIVINAADYFWSSCKANLGVSKDPLITSHEEYWALGNTPFERQSNYKLLLQNGLTKNELALIKDKTLKGWVLGTDDFVQLHQEQIGRRMSERSPGRPKGALGNRKVEL